MVAKREILRNTGKCCYQIHAEFNFRKLDKQDVTNTMIIDRLNKGNWKINQETKLGHSNKKAVAKKKKSI